LQVDGRGINDQVIGVIIGTLLWRMSPPGVAGSPAFCHTLQVPHVAGRKRRRRTEMPSTVTSAALGPRPDQTRSTVYQRLRQQADSAVHVAANPSFRFREEVHVGAVLPEEGVTYYDVPAEYHAKPGYRYAVVNDRPVIVDPRSRRIVEIFE
jgi:hypothetical protein